MRSRYMPYLLKNSFEIRSLLKVLQLRYLDPKNCNEYVGIGMYLDLETLGQHTQASICLTLCSGLDLLSTWYEQTTRF